MNNQPSPQAKKALAQFFIQIKLAERIAKKQGVKTN
jgi:hypothetical protein